MNNQISNFQKRFIESAYGMTIQDAHNKNICISCQKPIFETDKPAHKDGNIYSLNGIKEYSHSGLCEYCFDKAVNDFENDLN